jgi:putative membrane protein
MADDRPPLDRTALASDRTALANERTLAAWWRTAMATFALALGFATLFGNGEPAWLIPASGTLLVLLGVLILWTASRTYERTADRIESEHVVVVSRRTVRVGTLLLVVIAALCLAAVWLA